MNVIIHLVPSHCKIAKSIDGDLVLHLFVVLYTIVLMSIVVVVQLMETMA